MNVMSTISAPSISFRGQYRPRGHLGLWVTYCQRPSEPATWDELLVMPALAGCDLRVVRVTGARNDEKERFRANALAY
jgi:hypothetical protein